MLLLTSVGFAATATLDKQQLGQALFFDKNLSLTRNQSCGSCHEPGMAFTDGRDNGVSRAVSLGDDGHSLGSRNTPSIAYASHIPAFHKNDNGEYVGGFFMDGRAATMDEQAREPFLNPIEMAMPDSASVVARVRESPAYVSALQASFGKNILENNDRAFAAIASSIAAFESAGSFSTFDSKYDRFLRGEATLTGQEEIGRMLFFSQLINCHSCHLLDLRETASRELFSNYKYNNIGIPANHAVREKSGDSGPDVGLFANPQVDDPSQTGKFRVPSLRNVAVTGPYMHNGVFQELETAILFYDKYLLSTASSQTNPETGADWGPPEISENIELTLLRGGQPITPQRASALAAFLRTLTDKRYEALLDE
ncbi:MAG: cytochrome-c peroxidase [Woeseiaceae bacterium]